MDYLEIISTPASAYKFNYARDYCSMGVLYCDLVWVSGGYVLPEPKTIDCAFWRWLNADSVDLSEIIAELTEPCMRPWEKAASQMLQWDMRRSEIVDSLMSEFWLTKEEANDTVTAAQRRVLPVPNDSVEKS